mgnify:CR=1 FL=1
MLDQNQLEIVNSNEPRIIVEAGGGSGKTYTMSNVIQKLALDIDFSNEDFCFVKTAAKWRFLTVPKYEIKIR